MFGSAEYNCVSGAHGHRWNHGSGWNQGTRSKRTMECSLHKRHEWSSWPSHPPLPLLCFKLRPDTSERCRHPLPSHLSTTMLVTAALVSACALVASAAPAPTKYDWDCSSGKWPGAFWNHTHWWIPNTYYFGDMTTPPFEDTTCGIYYVPFKEPMAVIAKTFYPDGRPFP